MCSGSLSLPHPEWFLPLLTGGEARRIGCRRSRVWSALCAVASARTSCLVLLGAVCLFSTGITRFDLLGDFGRFNWLGNFYIVLSYNLLFAIVTTLCLVRKFTSAVREELLKALGNPRHQVSLSSCSSTCVTPGCPSSPLCGLGPV